MDTPTRRSNGKANLDNLFTAIDNLLQHINSDKLIVIKSTVPVGTNREISNYIKSKKLSFKVDVVSNQSF